MSEKTEKQESTILDNLLQNFSSENFDLNESYEQIQNYRFLKEDLKAHEAENILHELGPKYINPEYLEEMNKVKESFYSYVRSFDPNSAEFIDSTDELTKDKIYAVSQFLVNNYIEMINNILFNITWTVEEYKFIRSAFRSKIEYSGNEIFNSILLKETYLDVWEEMHQNLPKNESSFEIAMDIKNIVMMYHFLGSYKVKGFGNEYDNFLKVIEKIADTNKIFNAYAIVRERIQTDFITWSSSLSPEKVM